MARSRRRLVLGLAAAGAGLAGACLAWCQAQPKGASSGKLTAAEQAFWALELEAPQGSPLKMASLKGSPLLVNFWATWCPPCIEELPMLDQFYKENASRKWQVVGLAVDKTPAVRNFLQKTPVSFPIGVTGSAGIELCQSLGNTGGALPFSVVMGAGGGVIHRKMGKVTAQELKDWAA
jgi:thiol-disulfide isomerase/thioredoxin